MAWLPLIVAFAFLLSVIINLSRTNGDLVRQTNAKCPAKVGADPSLACQVQQLQKLLGSLDVEPVPGQPGVVRVVVPSPYVVLMSPTAQPAKTFGTQPRPSSTGRPTPRPSPTASPKPSPKPSPSPTCAVYNPLTGKCLP